MTDRDTEATKESVRKLLEGAHPQRVQSIEALLSLNDSEAIAYGDALSLLIDCDYNTGTLKQAIAKVKDEQGLQITRTRTNVRVFKFMKDEDNPDSGFDYRAFYVKIITPEQRTMLDDGQAEKMQDLIGDNLAISEGKTDAEKMVNLIRSNAFKQLLSQPNRRMRSVVLNNMIEVVVDNNGSVTKPLVEACSVDGGQPVPVPESILQQLEVDLRLLIEQQGVLAKNSQMADMLGS